MYSVKLNQKAISYLSKPVNGNGGYQELLRKLQGQYDQDSQTLNYNDDDLEKMRRYNKYDEGGFENILQSILFCIDKS
ncbi:hypothetical protein OQH61_07015 [Helicobacter sp. MIT 21-1697]|uniref:hypothetical protein n=1 Tax=Helicobacter sp. MIT 21-1697 TaxID=2993733 RepID=UPI00224BA007|nr:hypothetical protein [Helicobacter sp. MIT 21-1697]MCX2717480.1 hypothetical protein [Helicobacter sp. MIT 21-1697]